MIDLHYWPTPNGFKITIMLEECGLPYKIVPVNIGTGEQFKPEFLKISPNNRMPAIVDHDPPSGGAPVSVFESGAILQYLAEKSGKFLPKDLRGKYEVLQWVNWQMGGLGPMAGQANHFNMYAPQFNPPEALKYGQDR
jgi:GSH-dependent disulfide-bond oxidoreductase